jgi:hypothetical protein
VTHFEIYGDDPGKLATFYRELFGWRIDRAEGVDYWRIHLDPSDGSKAGGGLTYRPGLDARGWMQFVNVGSRRRCNFGCRTRRRKGVAAEDGSAANGVVRSARRSRGKCICHMATRCDGVSAA